MTKQNKLLVKQEQIAIVANEDQLEDRLSFEAEMAVVLLRLMNRQADEASRFFAQNGILPSQEEFKEQMQNKLFEEYIRIMDFSIGNFNLQNINEFAEEDVITDETVADFRQDMMFSLLIQSELQAEEITNTTFNQYNDQLVRAQEEAMADEDVPVAGVTTAFLADAMNDKVKQLNKARSELIAINEMTRVSEDVKFNFVLRIQNDLVTSGNPVNIVKIWNNKGDGKVREAHVIAGNQTQPLLSPFIVDGEQLNHPGDMSLGASLSNVIRCRCWAVYEIRA